MTSSNGNIFRVTPHLSLWSLWRQCNAERLCRYGIWHTAGCRWSCQRSYVKTVNPNNKFEDFARSQIGLMPKLRGVLGDLWGCALVHTYIWWLTLYSHIYAYYPSFDGKQCAQFLVDFSIYVGLIHYHNSTTVIGLMQVGPHWRRRLNGSHILTVIGC